MAAVTGVMIVTTLLMVIDLLTRTAATMAQATPTPPGEALSRDDDRRRAELLALLEAEATAEVVTPAQLEALTAEAAALQRLTETLEGQRVELTATTRRATRQAERSTQQADALAEELADVRRRTDAARRRPPVTLLEGTAAGKPTWWVRLAADGVQAGELRAPNEPAPDAAPQAWPDAAAFLADAAAAAPDSRAWVLLVTPEGVDAFTEVQETLRRRGFDVGWDLAPPPAPVEASP